MGTSIRVTLRCSLTSRRRRSINDAGRAAVARYPCDHAHWYSRRDSKIEPGLVHRTIRRGHETLVRAGIARPRIGVAESIPTRARMGYSDTARRATGGGGARPEVRQQPRRKSRATVRGKPIRTMATTAVTAAMTAKTERADAIRWIQAQSARDKVSPSMGLGSVCTCSDFNEGERIGPRASG